jgi:hypothetical protein
VVQDKTSGAHSEPSVLFNIKEGCEEGYCDARRNEWLLMEYCHLNSCRASESHIHCGVLRAGDLRSRKVRQMIMTRPTECTMFDWHRELQKYRASQELMKAVQHVVDAIVAGKVTMEDIQLAVERKQLPRFVARVL